MKPTRRRKEAISSAAPRPLAPPPRMAVNAGECAFFRAALSGSALVGNTTHDEGRRRKKKEKERHLGRELGAAGAAGAPLVPPNRQNAANDQQMDVTE